MNPPSHYHTLWPIRLQSGSRRVQHTLINRPHSGSGCGCVIIDATPRNHTDACRQTHQ